MADYMVPKYYYRPSQCRLDAWRLLHHNKFMWSLTRQRAFDQLMQRLPTHTSLPSPNINAYAPSHSYIITTSIAPYSVLTTFSSSGKLPQSNKNQKQSLTQSLHHVILQYRLSIYHWPAMLHTRHLVSVVQPCRIYKKHVCGYVFVFMCVGTHILFGCELEVYVCAVIYLR